VSRWAGTRLAVCAFECGEVAVKFGDNLRWSKANGA
jgi:hypothetical protein